MKSFIRKNTILIVSIILTLALTIFISSSLTTNRALETVTIQNFNHIANAKTLSLEHTIEGNIEAANSMSSRSAIRSAIVDYNNQTITKEELYDFTYSKYYDGFNVLNNVNQAIRMIDYEVLVDIGEVKIDIPSLASKVQYIESTTYEIIDGSTYSIVVYSPIVLNNEILGYDILSFSLDEEVSSLVLEGYDINIASTSDYSSEDLVKGYSNLYFIDGEYISYNPLTEDHALVITCSSSFLFSDIQSISNTNIMISIVLGAIITITAYFIFLKNTRELISVISVKHDYYKEQAMFDALTKTYSRQFLDQIMMEGTIKFTDTTVVMTDINSFKAINDTYGHLMGDEVLKYVGNCLKSSFRNDDYVIRYGGDEFLILVNNVNKDTTKNILKRINDIIDQNANFDFPISISHGISYVESLGEIEKGIDEADKNLYINKQMK